MHPTWEIPRGSYAQRLDGGTSRARRPASGCAFHGRRKFPVTTSSGSVPSLFGFDQGQQNPAVRRAVLLLLSSSLIRSSNCSADSTTANSNRSFKFHITFAVLSISSVLFTQLIKPSEPLQRN